MTPIRRALQRPLWLLAAASAVSGGLWLLLRQPDPPPLNADAKAARVAFCASVIDAIKPEDPTCGPYLNEARQHAKASRQPPPRPKPADINGWRPTRLSGIYWRWCDAPDCSTSKVIGDNTAMMVQVWCKTRGCGDIYGQMNLITDAGVVIGWTNDTAYGDYGQKVQLTFQSGQEGWNTGRITKLSVGGIDAL